MLYLGGKWRQGKDIARLVLPHLGPGVRYIEPFCGALGSAYWLALAATEAGIELDPVLSDAHQALITMWRRAFNGWIPPGSITKAEYDELKRKRDINDPRTAFAGFGCAFAAKYFGTYARHVRGQEDPEAYARPAKNSVLFRVAALRPHRPSVQCCEYQQYSGVTDAVFYLDPPYAGRTPQSKEVPKFDHKEFWEYARKLSRVNRVFVSEFVVPDDFVAVHSWGDTVVRYCERPSDGTDERLFVHRSQYAQFKGKPSGFAPN